jgi:hypothetical protein
MKKFITISAACIALLTASSSFAALEGPANNYRLDRGNVEGWGMMSRAERTEHRDRMHSFKTDAECNAYQEEHHKLMEQRAKERGAKLPKPRHNACSMMKSRGMFR